MADKRIPDAAIRRLWLDPVLTREQIGAQIGISGRQVGRRAAMIGLKPRSAARKRIHLPDDFAAMWRGGVLRSEIASLLDCSANHLQALARERGLKLRRPVRPISLATYRLQQVERADKAIRLQRAAPISIEAEHA